MNPGPGLCSERCVTIYLGSEAAAISAQLAVAWMTPPVDSGPQARTLVITQQQGGGRTPPPSAATHTHPNTCAT